MSATEGGIRLDGRVAIVTGAGRSLGRAYAIALADAGAAVVVNDLDADPAAEVVAEITARGGRAIASIAPVGPAETADQIVADAVAAFGRIDALVANAGVLRDRVLWKMSDADFDLVVRPTCAAPSPRRAPSRPPCAIRARAAASS